MDFLQSIISFILHIDDHLDWICRNYGLWTYAILLLIVFCETGLVVTPFLPGDSLLFAAGAICARGSLDVFVTMGILIVAAIAGDFVNYWVGNKLGARIARKDRWFLKREHLEKTHRFFEKHGGKAIILARFVPIFRTVAPFVAGLGSMEFRRFALYNVTGGIGWVLSMVGAGFLFGNIPFVKNNFEIVVLAIVFISLLPVGIEFLRGMLKKREVVPLPDGAPE